MRHVAILTPSYQGMIHVAYANSIFQTVRHIDQTIKGVQINHLLHGNIAAVPRMRNGLIAQALALGADDMIFIDTDIGWEVGDFLRLLSHPVGIVGGTYKTNTPHPKTGALTYAAKLTGETQTTTDSGLLQADRVPTGFLRITAGAAKLMMRKHPHLKYSNDRVGGDEFLYALFDYGIAPNPDHPDKMAYYGEDYWFCHLAREAGVDLWIDPWLNLTHQKVVALDGKFIETLNFQRVEQP